MVGEDSSRDEPDRRSADGRRPIPFEIPVRVFMLGGFRVSLGQRVVEERAWRSRKAAALVKLLALAPHHRLHREQILDLLWPDLGPEAANNNLHHTLHVARRILNGERPSVLTLEGGSVGLGTDRTVWTDVEAFETAARLARQTQDLTAYQTALDRYAGDLLPGDLYEDWATSRREELRALFTSLLLTFARLSNDRGERGKSIEALQRALSCDPTLEEAHSELMRVYAGSGQRLRALRQFEQLRQTLARELDTQPDALTRQLYEDIRAGQLPPAAASPVESASPERRHHNLPASLTSFVGRQTAVSDVRGTLASSRLLTLTGAGGTGKTRLALECARQMLPDYPDGIWLVELASLSNGEGVARTVARALSIEERGDDSLVNSMLEGLEYKRLLLVLDNCEHVIAAAAYLAETILRSCPRVQVLATSREPLDVPGEVVWIVPPLALPPLEELPPVDQLHDIEAIHLFMERAQARQSGFALTAQNATDVAQICRRLDGLPLAIELAAARVGVLSVENIAARLGNALALLTGGSRTAVPRQQTLRGALDWSYDLLDESERVVSRRLAVFIGGWTLEAAEAIGGDGLSSHETVLDLLSHLVDKSLVVAGPSPDGTVRYSMLEPVRQYTRELLMKDPMARSVQHLHATYFAGLAEQAQMELTGPDQVAWFQRLDQEHDNLRDALRHSIDTGDAETGLRLAGSLWRFWATRGYASEGRRFEEEVLRLPASQSAAPEIRARALNGAGALAYYQGDYAEAVRQYEAALSIRREMGDPAGVSRILGNLGLVAKEQGEHERAAAFHEESLGLARALGNKLSQAATLNNLGILIQDQGDYERAAALHEESLALMRELGDLQGIANSLNNLSAIALDRLEYDVALRYGEQALAMAREIDSKRSTSVALINLGRAAQERGNYAGSKERLGEAIRILEPTGDMQQAASCLEELATLACVGGQYRRAATLFGAAAGMRKASGSRPTPRDRSRFDTNMATARGALATHALEAAFQKGQAMKLEDVFAFALSTQESEQIAPGAQLTRREAEVAHLLGRDTTNRQIALELGIAERTVDTHVQHVLRKLGVSSRSQVQAALGVSPAIARA